MKAYFLSVALATSIGVNAYLVGAGVQPVNAVSLDRSETVCSDVPIGQTATVETFLGNLLCDDIKAAFGILTCPVQSIRQRGVSIHWGDAGRIKMCTHVKRAGNWVAE